MSTAEPVQKTAAPAAAGPAPAARRHEALNLARRPFVNTRPAVRVALLLWAVGLLLLFGNVTLFWSYLASSGEMRAELDRTEEQIDTERQTVSRLRQRLEAAELAELNEQVEYLNTKIDERTFSWSLLFDRIAEVLPNDVHLQRLAPSGVVQDDKRRTARRTGEDDGTVALAISGAAKSDEALTRFLDNLFAHPAFPDANLSRESRSEETGEIEFEVTASYLQDLEPVQGAAAGRVEVIEETPAAGATPTPGQIFGQAPGTAPGPTPGPAQPAPQGGRS